MKKKSKVFLEFSPAILCRVESSLRIDVVHTLVLRRQVCIAETDLLLHIFEYIILVSIVVSIPACHAGDRGSIPRRGDFFFHL